MEAKPWVLMLKRVETLSRDFPSGFRERDGCGDVVGTMLVTCYVISIWHCIGQKN
jgi:hypothetical protein